MNFRRKVAEHRLQTKIKQLSFSKIRATLYHYRATTGQEVDFLLEDPGNKIVAIEVKVKSKVIAKDFQHIDTLKADLGDRFERGFVLYQGKEIVPFGEKCWAIPLVFL